MKLQTRTLLLSILITVVMFIMLGVSLYKQKVALENSNYNRVSELLISSSKIIESYEKMEKEGLLTK